jgi:hypothetical protein
VCDICKEFGKTKKLVLRKNCELAGNEASLSVTAGEMEGLVRNVYTKMPSLEAWESTVRRTFQAWSDLRRGNVAIDMIRCIPELRKAMQNPTVSRMVRADVTASLQHGSSVDDVVKGEVEQRWILIRECHNALMEQAKAQKASTLWDQSSSMENGLEHIAICH